MKHLWPMVAAVAWLCLTPAAAQAQGEFPLKYVECQTADPVLMVINGQSVAALPAKPPELKGVPKGLSPAAQYFVVPAGGRQVFAVLDTAAAPRLYVDAAGTGDLSDAAPLPDAAGSPRRFGPVSLTAPGEKGPATSRVLFTMLSPRQLRISSAGYMAGEAKLAGQTYRVAAADSNGDGRYDQALDLPISRDKPVVFDAFAMDLDQDGKFSQDEKAGELLPLLKAVHVKDAYYSVKVAPDGSSVRLDRVEPEMGTLEVSPGNLEVLAVSNMGLQCLSGSGGKWRIPAGKYMLSRIAMTQTDATGTKWTLAASPGKPDGFEIRPGEVFKITAGPPLTAKVTASKAAAGQVYIVFALEGQAGEQYAAGAEKDNTRQPAPKFKILDEAGKVLAAGEFEYG